MGTCSYSLKPIVSLPMGTCGRRFRRSFSIKSSVFHRKWATSKPKYSHDDNDENEKIKNSDRFNKQSKRLRTYSILSLANFFSVIARLTLKLDRNSNLIVVSSAGNLNESVGPTDGRYICSFHKKKRQTADKYLAG